MMVSGVKYEAQDIRLNFINQSNTAESSSIVIFKDNAAQRHPVFAWKVLHISKGERQQLIIAETAKEDENGCKFDACSIWVGVMPEVSEGDLIDSSAIPGVTRFSLMSIASADIVVVGGGSGDSEFHFNLENVMVREKI